MFRIWVIIGLLWTGSVCSGQTTRPAADTSAASSWVWIDEDTVAGVWVDLQSAGMREVLAAIKARVAAEPGLGREYLGGFIQKAENLIAAGALDICLVGPAESEPFLVVKVGPNTDVAAVSATLIPPEEQGLREGAWPESVVQIDGAMLFGAGSQLKALAVEKPKTSKAVIEVRSALPGSMFQVIAPFGGASRKSILGTIPVALPGAAGDGKAASLAESVSWAGLGIVRSSGDLRLLVKMISDRAAQQLKQVATTAKEMSLVVLAEQHPELADFLKPLDISQSGPELSLDLTREQLDQAQEVMTKVSRRKAMQQLLMPRMEKISRAIQAYATAHDQNYPANLGDLVTAGLLTAADLKNPLSPMELLGYTYIAPKGNTGAPRKHVMVYRKFREWDIGVPVAMSDGSVRFIARQDAFEKLLPR